MKFPAFLAVFALLVVGAFAQAPNPNQSVSPTVDTTGFYRDTAPASPRKEKRVFTQTPPELGASSAQKATLKDRERSLDAKREQSKKNSVEDALKAKQKKFQAPAAAVIRPQGVNNFVAAQPPTAKPTPVTLTAKEKKNAEERGAAAFDRSASGKQLKEIQSELSTGVPPKNVLPKY